jgi:replicative DNA helicase
MNEIPVDTHKEEIILAYLMLDNELLYDLPCVDDFTSTLNVSIFEAISNLHNRSVPVNMVNVSGTLGDDIGILKELHRMLDAVLVTTDYDYKLEQLRKVTTRRQVYRAAMNVISKISTSDLEGTSQEIKSEIMQYIENSVKVIDRNTTDDSFPAIVKDILKDCENIDGEKKRCSWGLTDLEKMTGGIHPGEVTVIAGLTGAGKSAIMTHLSVINALMGKKPLIISKEMPRIQQGKRILSYITGIPGDKFRSAVALNDANKQRITECKELIDGLNIEINDKISTVQGVRAYIRTLKTKDRVDMVMIDYLQLIKSTTKSESKRLEINDITRQIKEISMEFELPIILLAQLNREAASSGQEPSLSQLKESGSIEQDADNVLFLHCAKDIDRTKDKYLVKLILAKQRSGTIGFMFTLFEPALMRFENYAGPRLSSMVDTGCPF